jgi:hypothetical protein
MRTTLTMTVSLAAALLAACGGDAGGPAAPAVETVVIELDRLGSMDAVAREAALSRGAPGEAEPVLYLLRSQRADETEQAVAEMTARGFGPVRPFVE